MPARPVTQFQPRKTPVQARAAVTVGAISEATIQVLLSGGVERLTTTRVAERAGVSVGTLYQYYPNKHSLLFAVLSEHLDKVASAVELACEQSRGKPLAQMLKAVVEAFLTAKLERPDISMALYQSAAEVGGMALAKRVSQRSRKALESVLPTAPDLQAPSDRFAIEVMLAAMGGATRHVLESGASPAMTRGLRHHLVVLCQSYMAASGISSGTR